MTDWWCPTELTDEGLTVSSLGGTQSIPADLSNKRVLRVAHFLKLAEVEEKQLDNIPGVEMAPFEQCGLSSRPIS